MMDLGYGSGDRCNRNGCRGIIDEHEKDGCCSCHIHPPCSYCTTDASYCDECGWDGEYDNAPDYNVPTFLVDKASRQKSLIDAFMPKHLDNNTTTSNPEAGRMLVTQF